MKKDDQAIQIEFDDPREDAAAIKQCLDYLREEAERTGLTFAAHIIAVAAQAVSDSIARGTAGSSDVDGEKEESLPPNRLH